MTLGGLRGCSIESDFGSELKRQCSRRRRLHNCWQHYWPTDGRCSAGSPGVAAAVAVDVDYVAAVAVVVGVVVVGGGGRVAVVGAVAAAVSLCDRKLDHDQLMSRPR